MFCNAIVEIIHHEPIESRLYIQALSDIEHNVRSGYRAFLVSRINDSSSTARAFYEKALELFDEDTEAWLWIETTEPGSGKAKGKGRNLVGAALLGALGFFAADVVDETKIYKDAKDAAVYAADLGYDYLREFVTKTEGQHELYKIKTEKEGDTLKIIVLVHPFIEERYGTELRRLDDISGTSA